MPGDQGRIEGQVISDGGNGFRFNGDTLHDRLPDLRKFFHSLNCGSAIAGLFCLFLFQVDRLHKTIDHPFDLIDDCTFDQPEARIEDEPPPERDWSVAFHRAGVHKTGVRARTEDEAIEIAQAMLFETDISLFDLVWCEDTEWQANLIDTLPVLGGASCR